MLSDFFLLSSNGISISIWVLFNPFDSIISFSFDQSLVIFSEDCLQLFIIESVSHLEAIVFESILGFDLFLDKFIFSFEFLSILDHLFDIFL